MAPHAPGRGGWRRGGPGGSLATVGPLNRLESALRRAARDLGDLQCPWALVGALAVSARTEPRFTRDIDLAVAIASDADAERLIRVLQGRGYRVHAVAEQEAAGRLATVRLAPPGERDSEVVLDLLFASSGIEPEVVAAAETLQILPGLRAPVATTAHLIALKLLARDDRTRPQDRADLVALVAVATPDELDSAREATRLIGSRGFHRGRDLPGDLDRLLADVPPGGARR